MPDAFGSGEFQAAMAIYIDDSYSNAYNRPPIMAADATLYIGAVRRDRTTLWSLEKTIVQLIKFLNSNMNLNIF